MEPAIVINPGESKWDIRIKVWDYIERNNLANFPRPVYHRIPNFKGAITACSRMSKLRVFTKATEVKVDPDKTLECARLAVLQAQKTLLVPTPRLRTGLFNKITPPQGANKEQLRKCASSQGVKEFSVPVGLDAKLKVDLVVVGSVAVSEKGFRIGKGEGFADMEYGMMASMGSVSDSTVVVTIVHDCQVVDIPEELIESHDLTVDYILTPSLIIKTNCQHPKPQGIIWSKLGKEKLLRIPILQELRALVEQAEKDATLAAAPGKAVSSMAGETPQEDPTGTSHQSKRTQLGQNDKQLSDGETKESEDRTGKERGKRRRRWKRKEQGPEEGGGDSVSLSTNTVHLWGVPARMRVKELKSILREREAAPLKLVWQGSQHKAFLEYRDPQAAQHALKAVQELSQEGYSMKADMAKIKQGDKRFGQSEQRRTPETTLPPDTQSNTTNVTEEQQQEQEEQQQEQEEQQQEQEQEEQEEQQEEQQQEEQEQEEQEQEEQQEEQEEQQEQQEQEEQQEQQEEQQEQQEQEQQAVTL